MQRRVSVAIVVTVLRASNGAWMSIAISAGRENAIRTAIRPDDCIQRGIHRVAHRWHRTVGETSDE